MENKEITITSKTLEKHQKKTLQQPVHTPQGGLNK
jgi:hypothetical protein